MGYLVKCSTCGGSGKLNEDSRHIGEDFDSGTCPRCSGTGNVEEGKHEPHGTPTEITPPQPRRR